MRKTTSILCILFVFLLAIIGCEPADRRTENKLLDQRWIRFTEDAINNHKKMISDRFSELKKTWTGLKDKKIPYDNPNHFYWDIYFDTVISYRKNFICSLWEKRSFSRFYIQFLGNG